MWVKLFKSLVRPYVESVGLKHDGTAYTDGTAGLVADGTDYKDVSAQ